MQIVFVYTLEIDENLEGNGPFIASSTSTSSTKASSSSSSSSSSRSLLDVTAEKQKTKGLLDEEMRKKKQKIRKRLRSRKDKIPDIQRLSYYTSDQFQPIIKDQIMFWRPQKVGSSTILSLLLSYGFRYNLLARISKNGCNAFCRKLAYCAFQKHRKSVEYKNNDGNTSLAGFLQDYLTGEVPGSGLKTTFTSWSSFRRYTMTVESIPFNMVVGHEICNLPREFSKNYLKCAFTPLGYNAKDKITPTSSMLTTTTTTNNNNNNNNNIKEIFVVRDPLARAVSIYYFWGFLFDTKSERYNKPKHKKKKKRSKLFAKETRNEEVYMTSNYKKAFEKNFFTYHGNQTTPPPPDIAMKYAMEYPLREGLPGPSKYWSVLGANRTEAMLEVQSDRLMTVVIERFDESLIAWRHYANWHLADLIHVKSRKALSSHPKLSSWPKEAAKELENAVKTRGEREVYDAANKKLTQRIDHLNSQGVNISSELILLKAIRIHVQELCMSNRYLERYRSHLFKAGIRSYKRGQRNNHMDVETDLAEQYSVNFNQQNMYSFDVCGGCESTGIEVSFINEVVKAANASSRSSSVSHKDIVKIKNYFEPLEYREKKNDGKIDIDVNELIKSLQTLPLLQDLPNELVKAHPRLSKCPHNSYIYSSTNEDVDE